MNKHTNGTDMISSDSDGTQGTSESPRSPTEALRQQINTLAYEVTDSDDVVKQIADIFVPFVTAYAATVEREALEMIKDRLPDPNNHVEEWRGHNLGLSQAIFLIDEELDRLAALQGPIQGDAPSPSETAKP